MQLGLHTGHVSQDSIITTKCQRGLMYERKDLLKPTVLEHPLCVCHKHHITVKCTMQQNQSHHDSGSKRSRIRAPQSLWMAHPQGPNFQPLGLT